MPNAKHQRWRGPSGQIQRLICEMRATAERIVSRVLAAAEELSRAAQQSKETFSMLKKYIFC